MTPSSKVDLSLSELYVTPGDSRRQNNITARDGEPQLSHILPQRSPQDCEINSNQSLPLHQTPTSTKEVIFKSEPNIKTETIMDSSSPPPSKGTKHDLMDKTKPVAKKTKLDRQLEDTEALLESENSFIYKSSTPVKSILQHPLAVATLNATSRGNQVAAADTNELNTAVALFKEDGKAGCHDRQWIEDANGAKQMRQLGVFDDMERAKFDRDWATERREISDDDDDKKAKKGSRKSCNEKNQTARKDKDNDGGDSGSSGFGKGSGVGHSRGFEPKSSDVSYQETNSSGQQKGGGQAEKFDTKSALLARRLLSAFGHARLVGVFMHPEGLQKVTATILKAPDYISPYPKIDNPVPATLSIQMPVPNRGPAPPAADPLFLLDRPDLPLSPLKCNALTYGGRPSGETLYLHRQGVVIEDGSANVGLEDINGRREWIGRGVADYPLSKYPEVPKAQTQTVQRASRRTHRRV